MDLIAFMTQTFDLESARTRQVLEAVTDDVLDFSPGEGLQSVRWNVSHLVNVPTWTEIILREDAYDVAPPGGEPETTPEVKSASDALAMWDENVAAAKALIAAADPATLSDPWTLKAGGQDLETLPRLVTFNQWLVTHVAHHRGHLLVALRLNGIEAPHIYG